MKKELQVIGAEVTGLDQVKVVCIPFTTPEIRKKKKSLMELAMGGGDIQELIQDAKESQQEKIVFFVTLNEWLEFFGNILLSHVSVDMDMVQKIERK